ncbi:MAG TPA: hypothetical protein VF543_03140 [Pyrinomonadaceae bacterium]
MISNRYIAMIDILGFAHLVETSPLMQIVEQTESILRGWPDNLYLAWVAINDDGSLTSGYSYELGKAHFSDTLILWTRPIDETFKYKTQEEFCFLQTVSQIICNGFLSGMPLRAGIGFGECYIDEEKGTYIGQALVNAYNVEKVQEWVGGALHPNCPAVESMNEGEDYGGVLVRHSIPVKPGSKLNLDVALDWTTFAQAPGEYGLSYQEKIRQAFENYLGTGLSANVALKYNNARFFAEQQIERGLVAKRFTEFTG